MKKLLSKKKLLAGLVALALTVLAVGIAVPVMAQSGNGPVTTSTGVYLDSPTLTRLAGVLGLTQTDLSNQLNAGKTLAQIALEKNVSAATLVDAIIAPYADQLASQLKYGYITQVQSQALLDAARQQAGNLLSQNLSVNQGSDNGYPGYGYCGGYMMGGAYGAGYGWGMMGPGMMGGWGGHYSNSTPAPTTGTTTIPEGTNQQAQPWNGGTGWGMMGGGMMRGW